MAEAAFIVRDDEIHVRTKYEHRQRCKSVPFAEWDAKKKVWRFPATPESATLLRNSFSGVGRCKVDKGFQSLLDYEPPEPELNPSDDTLLTPLWSHQQQAVELAIAHEGYMFAHDMGAGKTLSAISLILNRGHRRILTFAPRRVLSTWVYQIKEHAGDVITPITATKGTVAQRAEAMSKSLAKASEPVIVILNYETVARKTKMRDWLRSVDWDLLVLDECVPTDTKIATPHGSYRIDELRVGQEVWGYDHDQGSVVSTPVKHIFRRKSQDLIAIHQTRMTANHPVYSEERGYIAASSIGTLDTVYYIDESLGHVSHPKIRRLPGMRRDVYDVEAEQEILQRKVQAQKRNYFATKEGARAEGANSRTYMSPLWSKVHGRQKKSRILLPLLLIQAAVYRQSGNPRKVAPIYERDQAATRSSAENSQASIFRFKSVQRSKGATQKPDSSSGAGLPQSHRRQWAWHDRATEVIAAAARLGGRIYCPDWLCAWGKRISHTLQTRFSRSNFNDWHRSRWSVTQGSSYSKTRQEEGCIFREQRLDGPEILERGNTKRPRRHSRKNYEGRTVFNIETGTGNYFADGLLVHNCHRIKAPGGSTSKWIATLARYIPYRLALTGTPMPNSPLDLYAQFRAIDPTIFGTNYTAFRARYAITHPEFKNKILEHINQGELHEKFYSRAHRVETADVIDLPERTMTPLYVNLGKKAWNIYADLEAELYTWIEESDEEITIANALVKLLRLQQLTGGHLKTDEGSELRVDSAKQDALSELLEDLDEPVVVFAQFHGDLEQIQEAVEKAGRRYGEISGRVNDDDYDAWGRGEIDVIGVQIQAGGEGLNDLVRARICVFWSTGFSLGRFSQARARLLRPGQKNNVSEYHIVAEGTVDEKVFAALRDKQEIIDAILNP